MLGFKTSEIKITEHLHSAKSRNSGLEHLCQLHLSENVGQGRRPNVCMDSRVSSTSEALVCMVQRAQTTIEDGDKSNKSALHAYDCQMFFWHSQLILHDLPAL